MTDITDWWWVRRSLNKRLPLPFGLRDLEEEGERARRRKVPSQNGEVTSSSDLFWRGLQREVPSQICLKAGQRGAGVGVRWGLRLRIKLPPETTVPWLCVHQS